MLHHTVVHILTGQASQQLCQSLGYAPVQRPWPILFQQLLDDGPQCAWPRAGCCADLQSAGDCLQRKRHQLATECRANAHGKGGQHLRVSMVHTPVDVLQLIMQPGDEVEESEKVMV